MLGHIQWDAVKHVCNCFETVWSIFYKVEKLSLCLTEWMQIVIYMERFCNHPHPTICCCKFWMKNPWIETYEFIYIDASLTIVSIDRRPKVVRHTGTVQANLWTSVARCAILNWDTFKQLLPVFCGLEGNRILFLSCPSVRWFRWFHL